MSEALRLPGVGPPQAQVRTNSMPPFAALRAFEVFGRVGGVRRAAQLLSLDHAVVSRHLRTLEAWTGVKLIERVQGGHVRLTAHGSAYHARITVALNEISLATTDLTRRGDDSRLSICCVPGFASQWLAQRLPAYMARRPDLDIELHPTDSPPDFLSHDVDADIRYVPFNGFIEVREGLRQVEIARPRVVPVANPALLAKLGKIASPADLLDAPLLHEESQDQWRDWFAANGVNTSGALGGLKLWHAHLTVDAARRGQGIALANEFLLDEDDDRLAVIEGPDGGFNPVVLGAYVFTARSDRWTSPAIVKFRQWLTSEAQNGIAGR